MKGPNILRPTAIAGVLGILAMTVAFGCGSGNSPDGSTSGGSGAAKATFDGEVSIDGSSTVTPIFEAVAEEFGIANPEANVTVGTSGTGGGFKKFIAGETEISMASRPIKDTESADFIATGEEYIELPIAFDGLTVVVNNENTWVDQLTVEELKKIWEDGSKVNNWKQVRASFPDVPIKLYGPGTDSGTFDYFTLAINGKEKSSRADYQASEDDNVLVQGVTGDKGALGYFGYAYYAEQPDKLKAVRIVSPVNGQAIAPSEATIKDASYQPLSRPLLVYVKKSAIGTNPTLDALIKYLLSEEGSKLIASTGYVPFPANIRELVLKHYTDGATGTKFQGAQVGMTIEQVLSAEKG
jgi:phosphate transport system substrate-binding protein